MHMTYRCETRTFDRLHCTCGRTIKPYDFEADNGDVSLVCPSCHEHLLQIELIEDNGDTFRAVNALFGIMVAPKPR
jgi:hypothetical protein